MKLFIFAFAILPAVFAWSGSPAEYHDILGEGKAEWRLAFRGTAHTGHSVYKAYTEGYNHPEEEACKGVDFSKACNSHYRNDDALDNWWMVKEVLFGIVKQGALVKTIRFNGAGSDSTSWFDQANYQTSCFKDLESAEKNYFSIKGHSSANRRFFINHDYNSCGNNEGWFVAIDGDTRNCNWERDQGKIPILKFAAGPHYVNWNEPAANHADAFVVFVRYFPYGGQPSEYFDVFDSGSRDYRLAFRASAGVGVPAYPAYMKGTGIPADVAEGCKSTDWAAECKSHYRNNDALDNYKWQEIEEVLFGVVDDGAIVKYITFKAQNTNYVNWFHTSRVLESCWSDFNQPKNYFGIAGHQGGKRLQRAFFINRSYGGCPNDVGWVVAIDNLTADKPHCEWEHNDSIPSLRYAAGPLRSNWLNKANIHHADAFVVFIKYKKPQ